jgi:hypothetical protein
MGQVWSRKISSLDRSSLEKLARQLADERVCSWRKVCEAQRKEMTSTLRVFALWRELSAGCWGLEMVKSEG